VAATDSLDDVVWHDLRPVLDEEVDRLPEKYRAAVVLCYLEGKTYEEASRQLRCSKWTLATRLARARQRLHRQLTARGLALSGAALVAGLGHDAASGAVPSRLVAAAVQGAVAVTTGTAAGMLSARVANLTDGVLQTMPVSRFPMTTALLLALGVAGMGAVMFGHRLLADKPAEGAGKPAAEPVAASAQPPRTDRYGDPLPRGAVGRLGTVRFRQGQAIEAMALSRDGKILVTGSGALFGTLCQWDVATGHKARRLQPADDGFVMIQSVAVAPDGKTLVSAGLSGAIHFWDATTGKEVRTLRGLRLQATGLSFSPDGRRLAVAYQDEGIRVWDLETGKERPEFQKNRCRVYRLVYSPDGKHIASGGWDIGYPVQLWDAERGKELHQLRGVKGGIKTLVFSPDGKTLAAGGEYDPVMWLWDVSSGRELRRFPGHDACGVRSAAFSPDGRLLASGSGVIRLWDTASGEELRRFPQGITRQLAFLPYGKSLLAASSGAVRVWDVGSGKEINPREGHEAGLYYLACLPGGNRLVTAGRDGTMRLWEVASGKEMRRFGAGPHGTFNSVALSADGRVLASAVKDNTYRITVHDGKTVSISDRAGDTIHLWSTTTGQEIGQVKSQQSRIDALAFTPDRKVLFMGDFTQGTVGLYDVASGKLLRQLDISAGRKQNPFRPILSAIAFAPDGKTIATADARTDSTSALVGSCSVRLWDMATGKELHELRGHQNEVHALALSPDGTMLASGGEGFKNQVIRIWDVASGKLLHELPQGGETLAFSTDGRTLAAASQQGRTIRLWDVATGKQRRTFEGHGDAIRALAISPDGRTLFSGSADSTALVWDLTAPKP
jgi:WD40 repeat protein